MRTVALIQARMGSTRLPGKVMAPIGGRPALALVLERSAAAPGIDVLAVATTDLERDDVIERFCEQAGVPCVRGSETDVLDRYHVGAVRFDAELVVRITADCPLIDPGVIGALLALRDREGWDWAAVATGALGDDAGLRRYPDGLDCEVFTAAALELAWREGTSPYDREHVTPFIGRDPRLKRGRLEADEDRGYERWTVDHPQDLELVRSVVERLGPACRYEEILALLDREPALREVNAELAQPSRT